MRADQTRVMSRVWERVRFLSRAPEDRVKGVPIRVRNHKKGLPIPPPHLIYLVAGTEDVSWFLGSGGDAVRGHPRDPGEEWPAARRFPGDPRFRVWSRAGPPAHGRPGGAVAPWRRLQLRADRVVPAEPGLRRVPDQRPGGRDRRPELAIRLRLCTLGLHAPVRVPAILLDRRAVPGPPAGRPPALDHARRALPAAAHPGRAGQVPSRGTGGPRQRGARGAIIARRSTRRATSARNWPRASPWSTSSPKGLGGIPGRTSTC